MKDFWEEVKTENTKKKLNKKKIIIISIIAILLITLTILTIVYTKNQQARDWIDKNIFRKEVMQDKTTTIELKDIQNSNIYAFNRYIGILNKNKFSIYGNTGNEEKTLDIQITNPVFSSENRFLAIGESGGQKVYLIENKEISWETEIEGNISQIHVNKNGYVAVVMSDASNKTVIQIYNTEGKSLFKKYAPYNRSTDVSISNDNKYLAVAEIDTAGTIIQSNIKIISIEKASTESDNSIENTYKCESGKLLTNLKYQDKNILICMYTDSITKYEDGQETLLIDNKDRKVIFQSIELNGNVSSIEEKSSGLFTADSLINIVNTENSNINEYTVNSIAKEIYTNGNIIALNLGTEVEFINTGGWLVKRYRANQEITNVAMSENVAGIIYRDKIEIINL